MIMQYKYRLSSLLFIIILFFNVDVASAQSPVFGHGNEMQNPAIDSTQLQTLQYRNIGPYRGGRSVAVAGHPNQPDTYFTGFTGGGVYKTTDGGNTWLNVSDGYFKTGSVGALAVAPSDANVVYAGMGETCIRGNMSAGDGVYKSVTGGDTWKHIGLGDTHFIGEMVVHPKNPDVVWVAALGHAFGSDGNERRGVFKTTDGGQTWSKVLYKGPKAGAVDIEIDPTNPRVLYASLWEAYRTPWKMVSGGPGSGLYKSTDGGETWTNISTRPGMPKGVLGKIGVAVSPVNPDRVWAMVENDNGGVFRSDDKGKTWTRTNKERNLRQRAWYYTHIVAGTEDEDAVYVLNVNFHKSTDGGQSFKSIGTPHGDHHDLWIDPTNAKRMVVADDGGGQVTYNGGRDWSSYYKYATAQFYHVILDNSFPYWIYGAQQDNSTVAIKSRTAGYGIGEDDWHAVAGGESGYIAPDPDDPDVTYGGSYGGYLNKFNYETKQSDRIDVWPDNPMGAGAAGLKYRFQWTFPIYISPHNSDALYATSQYVHRSSNEGMSWERISPDLTRNDKSKQQESGGPITKDDTSIEYYNTVFSFAESPVEQGVLWAGADDGLVHMSRDNGENWDEVTPAGMPEALVSIIDPSPHEGGTAYMAATRYKFGDFAPMLYKTDNYGRSWTRINDGIPAGDFTRVIREDPNRKGLLYAGTETGVYVSFNDGGQWQPLQLNLPAVPITDLRVHKREKDLVVATQGRSFWVLDDLSVLHQMQNDIKNKNYLFAPETSFLFGGPSFSRPGGTAGQNPAPGVVVHYNLKNSTDQEIQLQFTEPDGSVIRTYSSKEDPEGKEVEKSEEFYEEEDAEPVSDVLSSKKGLNAFDWDMSYPGATDLDGRQILWAGSTDGPSAIPGTYQVRLLIDGNEVATRDFKITKDPRIDTTQEDFEAQFSLQQNIIAKLDTTHKSINKIRTVRGKINEMMEEETLNKQGKQTATAILDELSTIESTLMQTKAESYQDVLNYPIKLNNKLAALANTVATGDNRPTEQQYGVYEELAAQVDEQLVKLQAVLDGEFSTLTGEVDTEAVPIEQ
jgi:photosystem II stability/assembly factor-like uncharacterized protein